MTVIIVPVSAKGVTEHDRAKGKVRVAIRTGGEVHSQLISVESGTGEARFEIEGNRPVTVALGPEKAKAVDLFNKSTATTTIPAQALANRREYTLHPVVITAPVWRLWWFWCKSFTISGHVYGTDGNPVPSAAVSAYNVDYFWWWSSTFQVGSTAVTDPTGYFSITFEWCCGWLPWYWWELRDWRLDPILIDRLAPVLALRPDLQITSPSVRPVLGFTDLNPQPEPPGRRIPFDQFNPQPDPPGRAGGRVLVPQAALTPTTLPGLRQKLLASLPTVPEFERLCLWPWCDWWPWLDCAPNIIFNVTQSCGGLSNTIVQETIFDTRFDIADPLSVNLYANDQACTISTEPGQPEGDCFLFTNVCGIDAENVAIPCDTTVPPAASGLSVLAGLAYPGLSDQPFSGGVFCSGQFGTAAQADYYEITYRPLQPCPVSGSAPGFVPVPPAALGAFQRTYFDATQPYPNQWFNPTFAPTAMPVSGGGFATVFESRQYFEANTAGAPWGNVLSGRSWTGNADGLGWIETAGYFSDGQYEFQIVGYTADGDGTITAVGPLAGCGLPGANDLNDNNDWALYFANPLPTNIDNPQAGITNVVFTLFDPVNGTVTTTLPACGILTVPPGGAVTSLAVSFTASDPEGFLDAYSLSLQWGTTGRTYITGNGALTPGPIVGPSYAAAISQGASRPFWFGGAYTLTITDPGTLATLFPQSCAYEMELDVYKRNIVSCNGDDPYQNSAFYSFTVLFS